MVLPDLPLHGDSEDRPRHPYTLDWFAEVIGGFAADVLGPRPLIGGHDAGAEILLHAVATGRLQPAPAGADAQPPAPAASSTRASAQAWRLAARGGSLPGLDRLLCHAHRLVFTPELGMRLSERGAPAAGDLIRHAFADVPGNPNLARSWAKCARRWPRGAQTQLLDALPAAWRCPCCCCGPTAIPCIRWRGAEEALRLLPHGQLRVLPSTGFLMAYDDPVGVARELAAFCG